MQSLVFFIHYNAEMATLFQNSLTQIVASIYNNFFTPVAINNNRLIQSDTGQFLIVDNECTALMLSASVAAAIFATQYSFYLRMQSTLFSLKIIQSQNILRILHLVFESQTVDNSFDFYHLYFWQLINFLTALCVIFFADRYMKKKQDSTSYGT